MLALMTATAQPKGRRLLKEGGHIAGGLTVAVGKSLASGRPEKPWIEPSPQCRVPRNQWDKGEDDGRRATVAPPVQFRPPMVLRQRFHVEASPDLQRQTWDQPAGARYDDNRYQYFAKRRGNNLSSVTPHLEGLARACHDAPGDA